MKRIHRIFSLVLIMAIMLGITSPALSHHLRILKGGNILTSRREKKEVFFATAQ